MKRILFTSMALLVLLPSIASARINRDGPKLVDEYSGPRVGVTVLAGDMWHAAQDKGLTPVISQFGWQFETRFANSERITGLIEWVPLIGGLEQGKFIPSFSALVGLRIHQGFDIAVGPNIAITQTEDPAQWFGLVVAAGQTIKTRDFAFPIHVAVVPRKDGARVSLLMGFSWN